MRYTLNIGPLAIALTIVLMIVLKGPAASTVAAQTPGGTCGPVLAADEKQVTTPHHSFVTTARGGRNETGESITAGGVNYVSIRGQWRRSPLTPKDMLEQKRENVRSAKSLDCQVVREEAVNGAAATVYHVHSVVPDVGTQDGQVWIAKSTGLPVKIEMDTDSGDGPATKMHSSTRVEYEHVEAPAGVK